MRIALVIPGTSGGGVRSVVRIATGLAHRGHQVRVLYKEPSRSTRDMARSIYLRFRYGGRGNWTDRFPGEARQYRRLTADIAGENDCVVGVGVDCVLEIAQLPPSCGIKVHNSRGVEPWIHQRMMQAWALNMPRIVVGGHLVPKMRDAGSTDPIFVAHNGVDAAEYFPSLPAQERLGVGAVYHGGDVKDPDLILATFQRLHSARPELPLFAFGTFPHPNQLPDALQYTRLPSTAAARDVYSRCIVWFLASRNEGLPNPLLEAMSCGASVVSTDCGGAGDIIQHERNGLIVPVGDATSMIKAIIRLLDDQSLRDRFSDAARVTLAHYTWPNAVTAFETALHAIVAGADQKAHLDAHSKVAV